MNRFNLSAAKAAIVMALACGIAGCDGAPAEPAPGIILIVLDTARADHFGVDGYARDTTPNMDRIADDGAWFSNAWAQAPWTLPTIASILTGQPPSVHGAGMENEVFFALRDTVPTLAERLSAASIRTGAVMNVVFCNPASGLDRGFDSYNFRSSDPTNLGHRSAASTTDAALGWAERIADDPFFLLVHYFDAHLTYDPPAPFDTRFLEGDITAIPPGFGRSTDIEAIRDGSIPYSDELRDGLIARYDGELAYLDQEIGRLRAGLEEMGRWDDSLIVIVGDHGEEFWDHGGFEHGHSHFREMLRVPLIVRHPGAAAQQTRTDRVRQLDIVPTVLNFFGLAVPDDLPGIDLTSGHAESATADGTLWEGDVVSVRTDEGTLILNRDTGVASVFDSGDTLELRNLADSDPELLERLMNQLDVSTRQRDATDRTWSPSEDELQNLRSLGYIK